MFVCHYGQSSIEVTFVPRSWKCALVQVFVVSMMGSADGCSVRSSSLSMQSSAPYTLPSPILFESFSGWRIPILFESINSMFFEINFHASKRINTSDSKA